MVAATSHARALMLVGWAAHAPIMAAQPAGLPTGVVVCQMGQLCGGQIKVSCGSPCQPDCSKTPPKMCNSMCWTGNQCPAGQQFDKPSTKCVPSAQCGTPMICAGSGPQTNGTKMMCTTVMPQCPPGQCAMRQNGSCTFKCQLAATTSSYCGDAPCCWSSSQSQKYCACMGKNPKCSTVRCFSGPPANACTTSNQACKLDQDCPTESWCRQTTTDPNGAKACAKREGELKSCEGYTMPQHRIRCMTTMDCFTARPKPGQPMIADAPGKCMRKCGLGIQRDIYTGLCAATTVRVAPVAAPMVQLPAKSVAATIKLNTDISKIPAGTGAYSR